MSKTKTNKVPLYKLISNKRGKSFVQKYWVSPKDLERYREKQRFDSKDKHTNSLGRYNEERTYFHNKVVDSVVSSCPKAKPGEKPRVIILSGGAASGKSTVVDRYILPKYGDVFGTLNVDDIKAEIPEYGEFVKQDVMSAANRVHEESSDMGKKALKRIIEEGRNVIYDAVLGNSEKAKKLIHDFKERGYDVELVSVTVDTQDAWERSVKRGLGTEGNEDGSGRFVDQKPFFEGHRGVVDTFEICKDLLDNYKLFDNNVPYGEEPILVENNDTVLNPELKEKFVSKKEYYPDLTKALELDVYLQSFEDIKKAFDNDLIGSDQFAKAREVMMDIFKSMEISKSVSFGDDEYKSLSVNDLMEALADNSESQHYCDAVVVNRIGKLLLVQRSNNDSFQGGKWCLPGGKAEHGEFLRDAVKRELFEETGLIASNCNYSTLYRNEDGSFSHYFYCYVDDCENTILDADEIQQYVWVDLFELHNYECMLDISDRIKNIFNIPFKGKYLTTQELAAIASNKIEKSFDIDEISTEEYFDLIKGGKKYQVGEISQSTGMKKVGPNKWVNADTGNEVKVGEDGKMKESKPIDVSKLKDTELAKFAKNSSEADLMAVIKESREPKLREAAHKELDRRKKKESIQEKEDKKTK